MVGMSIALKKAATKERRQDVIARNVTWILPLLGLKKKDLAKVMRVSPQAMSARLKSDTDWTIDEAFDTAAWIGIPLEMLMDGGLTPASLLAYLEDHRNGGQDVASSDGRRRRAWILAA